jgi:hypothetical protein
MLADYGLEMRHELNRRHADEPESCDNDAAYLVGQPAQQESGIIVYQVTHAYSDAPNRMSSHSRVPVVSTGAVTAGIEARFKALMDDYPSPSPIVSSMRIPVSPRTWTRAVWGVGLPG